MFSLREKRPDEFICQKNSWLLELDVIQLLVDSDTTVSWRCLDWQAGYVVVLGQRCLPPPPVLREAPPLRAVPEPE